LKIAAEVLSTPLEELSKDSHIRDDLGADSLDLVTLIWALEEEFGGKLDDTEMESLATPAMIAAYINQRSEHPSDEA